MLNTSKQLPEFPEDWESALVITAHPDDVEYPSAAPIAKWVSKGKKVKYLFITSGERGIDSLPPKEAAPLRRKEQLAAAKCVGVEEVDFLAFPDGTLEYSLEMRKQISTEIRRFKPDTVLIGCYRERIGNGMLNMADHIAVGKSAVAAVRDASNRWVFQDEKGTPPPWQGVRYVAQHGSPLPTHFVVCEEYFDISVNSLLCHTRYLKELGVSKENVREMLRGHHEQTALLYGGRPGITFEMLDLKR